MIAHYILVGCTLVFIFVMFLVISRTLNNMVNILVKLEYSLQKEFDLKQEALEVRRMMEEEFKREQAKEQELEKLQNEG